MELLFTELKSRFDLDEIDTTDAYMIEALLIMSTISLLMSRVIVDELRKLDARQQENGAADADRRESASRLPRRQCSLTVERHAHLIQLYLMLEVGDRLSDLDELLLYASQNPNPHGQRLRGQVESGGLFLTDTKINGCPSGVFS